MDAAYTLAVPGDSSAWLVLAGSRRERPSSDAIEVVGGDELWLAVPGEWWVLCGYTDAARSVNGYKVHAAAPFEAPRSDDEILWVDLDLDFEVRGDEVALQDETQYTTMPAQSATRSGRAGAWSDISTIAARYTNGDWPFDGSMQEWVDAASLFEPPGCGPDPQHAPAPLVTGTTPSSTSFCMAGAPENEGRVGNLEAEWVRVVVGSATRCSTLRPSGTVGQATVEPVVWAPD